MVIKRFSKARSMAVAFPCLEEIKLKRMVLKSYVREEDGSVTVKCYSYHEGGDGAMRSGKVHNEEDLKDLPLSLQV
ncbi:hypothetical protein MtrunA17_Chr4g0028771 [Medicago truncatula]|uniref:Uncharacterized protein n=1 Tax=Medicago truncatula TaxID=3880 RepID=A0A396I7B6_MEDTR|nr:hypothetical protein MtrunA17_Chr4g0028771 [Medicago truncatula]